MPSIQAILVTSTLLVLLAAPQHSLALSNAGPVDHQANRRHHAAILNSNARMIKKRQGVQVPPPAGGRPTSSTPAPSQVETTTAAAPTTPTTTAAQTTTTAPTSTSTTPGIIDNILSQSTTTTSAAASLTNSASTTATGSTLSAASSQVQTTAPATSANQNPQITPPADPDATTPTTRRTPSTVQVVSNVTASASATAASKEEDKPSQFGRNSIIAIAVIASCIGGAAAIWTLIRKWKLSPSRKFDERMNPIEWTPDNVNGSGIEKDAVAGGVGSAAPSIGEKHQRAGSTGSRGSLRSSAHEQDNIGRNVTGNGNMFADQDPHQVVPPHDFTAGAATGPYEYNEYNTAATGYVDLQRGNSTHLPGSGTGLTRGPSVNHGYDYNYPPQDAAAYDYDNSHYATGGYAQQPADLHRGPSLHRGQDPYAADAYGAYDASQYPVPNDPYAQYNQNAYGQPGYQQGRY